MTYYHATSLENMKSILEHGLKPSDAGCVYLADSPENAAKFISCRMDMGVIFSFDISKADEQFIEETFNHSEEFFKCKAFGYFGAIPPDKIKFSYMYKRGTGGQNYLETFK